MVQRENHNVEPIVLIGNTRLVSYFDPIENPGDGQNVLRMECPQLASDWRIAGH
jgi:hypothetical protein